MKKYWLFAGDSYYPLKGLGDFKGAYDSLVEAKEAGESWGCDWYCVVEVENNEPVAEHNDYED